MTSLEFCQGPLTEPVSMYFDLWHGECREANIVEEGSHKEADFLLQGFYADYLSVLNGNLHPMQALFTRKLIVQGYMGLLMRNVPTVLGFVHCAKEITDSTL